MSLSKNRKVYELWQDIQDIVGKADLWPQKITTLMWTQGVRHGVRMILAAFIYFNGLNPDVFFEWADLLNLCSDEAAKREFHSIFKAFKEGKGYVYAYVVARN